MQLPSSGKGLLARFAVGKVSVLNCAMLCPLNKFIFLS